MTRLGWIILALIAAAGAAFASMLSIGAAPAAAPAARPAMIARRAAPAPSAPAAPAGMLIVPVAGVPRAAITDTWGQARSEGRVHHGTDIPAPGGAPVLAAAAGTIEKLFQSRLGGTTLYERSADHRWTYYYAHLAGYVAGLREGQAVRPGQPIAFVGDTGDAGRGNFHLHFALARLTPDQHWWQGEDVNAFPLLAGRGGLR